ncbi:hypothetical protein MIS45_04960 [Wielerella bovis]|uniref:toxin-antitoxin system YwqK family antitoxin n=1 Tax=Wielerella bovis TaxID=2917790 RepID=UPI002019565A|nr:hypothetical protein [Wielerella bovis]ULJ70176.1 hypothetical protein MIS45_04960 [Wielerella bovis]
MQKWIFATALTAVISVQAEPRLRYQHIAPRQADVLAKHSATEMERAIVQPELRFVGYFDENGQATAQADGIGYFRMQLGKTADGRIVIQDFHQSSRTKYTDPFIVPKKTHLNQFQVTTWAGFHSKYLPTGQLQSFVEYENGERKRSAYYAKGRLRLVENEVTGEFGRYAYYPNGKPMLIVVERDGKMHGKMFNTRGQVVYDSRRDKMPINANSPKARAIQRVMSAFQDLKQEMQAANLLEDNK